MTRRPHAETLVAVEPLIDDPLLRTFEPTFEVLDRLLAEGAPTADADGQPDGFDGLDRTGALEHLVATEWLLVAEEPDEFVRRFSERELAYLRPARVEDHRAHTSLVLFDTGPDQIGSPRIVQVACLQVLARRSRAGGSVLRWGTLHDDARHVVRGRDDVVELVRGRTAVPAPTSLPLDAVVDDCLVVSPSGGAAARQLVLVDVDDGVEATLIDRTRGTTRTVLVPLPAPADAVRLLRERGASTVIAMAPSTDEIRPTSNLVFDLAGNKVLARNGDGAGIVVFPAPNSTHMPDQRVRVLPGLAHLGPVSAAGRVGRAVVTATLAADGREVFVHRHGATKGRAVPEGRFPIDERIDGDPAERPLGTIELVGPTLRIRLDSRVLQFEDGRFHTSPPVPVLRWGDHLMAVESADGWMAGSERFPPGHPVADGRVVFGVWEGDDGVELLAHDHDRVVLSARSGAETLVCRAEAPILDAVAHTHRPLLAYRTVVGHVVVRTFPTGTRRFRWSGP